MTADKPRIVVLFTDAGGGHRATAAALAELLADAAEVVTINPYREALSHLDAFARLAGVPGEQIYNSLVLRRGWTGTVDWLFRNSLRLVFRLHAADGRRSLAALWRRLRPDLVVSVMPWLNATTLVSLADAAPEVPFVVLPTDMAVTWRDQWYPTADGFVAICGTDALAAPLAGRRVETHRAAGLLIRRDFLRRAGPERTAARQAAGLDPDRPTLCLLYGGHGSRRMLALARALRQAPPPVQAIFLCGRNAALADALRAERLAIPHRVEGFTEQIADWLRLADLFVGKPGPGSMSEALALGLPLLLDAAGVLPQERSNLDWAVAAGLARRFADPAGFRGAVEGFAAGGLSAEAAAARRSENRAAEEIRAILLGLLPTRRRQGPEPAAGTAPG
jgi:1,2-diacylglycerol 3-beta-galactosyltransferase